MDCRQIREIAPEVEERIFLSGKGIAELSHIFMEIQGYHTKVEAIISPGTSSPV